MIFEPRFENVGQFDERARFRVYGGDRDLWLTDDGLSEVFGIAAEYGTGDSEKPVRGIGELEPDRSGGASTGDEVGVVVGDGIGDRGRRVHKPDGRSDHPLQRRPEQRVVGAAEDHGLDTPVEQRMEVVPRNLIGDRVISPSLFGERNEQAV